jgi:hypothetical protein
MALRPKMPKIIGTITVALRLLWNLKIYNTNKTIGASVSIKERISPKLQ